ncbi:MAG: Gfo/Idh/MocA family oxidoreductase [Saprospiraceae bacterium]|jgi:hypothetical protein|nr:Gfo/Idh/MocA family oxidoreductase [Saprospiraceae bacterium]MBK7371949.1 Gfo/Idh/MocA family oxidoreductase [Saprospiraceae bacterium]MBK7435583.1 Gfo/Idh/MocA family oxidoreductase [Saprospiraceae bacterium]MBK9677992.1 Gfo/Idh/MocA family oxidoreductase [Saprospiraceae bacterium]MBP7923051.1 Gfo/Idh/MocA family oxidoreductase [Saprospiraceae bacterium]
MKKKINRRAFLENTSTASVGALAFHIVPGRVLGGWRHIAPSDKLNIAYIGCGTQGLREMCQLIQNPKIQINAVCDVNKMSTNYVDWSPNGIRDGIRKVLGDDTWGANFKGIPGGRDIGKNVVDQYYNKVNNKSNTNCAAYEDFRELFIKEKDFDAVKIMTPDHLHGYISIEAMKHGKQVVIHKPIANRMYEAKKTIQTAKETGMSTHLLAWAKFKGLEQINTWIQEGQIGDLKEIHNWSNRPVWPQWTSNPSDTPPVPDGFNWDLWLGPVPDRPYHPNYTFNVFRGWYDFGGGSIADMGHYSLWPLFLTIGVESAPLSAEATGTTTSAIENQVCKVVQNEVAFPYSTSVKFKFPRQSRLPAFDLFWYDGGIRPSTPEEMGDTNLEREGMMFKGDQGMITAGFRGENPKLINKDNKFNNAPLPRETSDRKDDYWIDAFKNKKESPGSFLLAGPVTETILLGAVSMRAKKRLKYDSASMKITNDEAANKYLYREYRKGWEL